MKLPLQIILPIASIIIGAATAIGVGMTNLAIADAFSHTEPVIFAAGLTAAIMVVAGLLSARHPNPDPEDHAHH